MKSAGEVAAQTRESVNKLQRKAFSLTRAQARCQQKEDPQATQESPKSESQEEKPVLNSTLLLRKKPTVWVKDLVEVRRFSSLSKLVRVIAWVCQAAKQWCQAPKHKVGGNITQAGCADCQRRRCTQRPLPCNSKRYSFSRHNSQQIGSMQRCELWTSSLWRQNSDVQRR